MKRRILLFAFVLTLMLFVVSVQASAGEQILCAPTADNVFSVEYYDANIVPGEYYSITVLKPGTDFTQMTANDILCMKQVLADNTKTISVSDIKLKAYEASADAVYGDVWLGGRGLSYSKIALLLNHDCASSCTHHEAVPADCYGKSGTLEYWKCNTCQRIFDNNTKKIIEDIVDYPGHRWESGNDGTLNCTGCGAVKCIVGSGETETDICVDGILSNAELTQNYRATIESRLLENPSEKITNAISSMNLSNSEALALDINLFKVNGETKTQVTQASQLVKLEIALPEVMEVKKNYYVLRLHGNVVDTIGETANSNGEYFTVDKANNCITIYAKKFSEYAIVTEGDVQLADTEISFEIMQGDEAPTYEFTYKVLDINGNDTGERVNKEKQLDINTSYVGTFDLMLGADYGQSILCHLTVSNLTNILFENFQGYEDDVVATNPRPYYAPYDERYGSDKDQVAFDVDGNKVCAIYPNGRGDTNDNRSFYTSGGFSAGEKFDFSYKVKLDPTAKDNFNYFYARVKLMASDNQWWTVMEPRVGKDSNGIYLSVANAGESSGKVYPGVDFGEWITINGTVNIGEYNSETGEYENHSYTVSCKDVTLSGTLKKAMIGPMQLSFCDPTLSTESVTYTARHLLDDIEANTYLKVDSIKDANTTIFLGDEGTVLPTTVKTVLSDGISVSELPVVWNGTISTDSVGSQSVTGTIPGYTQSYTAPTLTVTVTDLPYSSEGILIHDKEGYTVTSLSEGCSVKGITLKKVSNNTYNSKIYIGVFHEESNKLLQSKVYNIDSTQLSWAQGESKYFEINMTPEFPDGINPQDYTVKAFVLDTVLKPLSTKALLSEAISSAKIWLTGDSTTCEYADRLHPETGWGEKLQEQFNNVTVINEALGGQSAKSFYDQKRLQKILINSNPGDYLFIMFGINDAKDEAYRHTEPGTTYNEYLKKFISEAREYGMTPILLTSTQRHTAFQKDGTVVSIPGYPEETRKVAKEENVPLIDVHSRMIADMEKEGAEAYKQYYMIFDAGIYDAFPNGSNDPTHLSEAGAEKVTSFVIDAIKELNLPLASLCKD